jgi:tripartite-type tricarboxylate transporter receptor subunit TctC
MSGSASGGNGSTQHISGELFKMKTGVDMVHVPYRGSTPAVTDLIAGQVQVMFDVTPTALPQVKAGHTRALGVSTVGRLPGLPDVPPIGDFVKGYEASAWIGIGAPKDTPPEIIAVLNKEVNAALGDATIQKRLTDIGAMPLQPSSPAEFAKFIADDVAKWAKVIKASGMKPE